MSNDVHGLTLKDEDGKVKAHPLYWVWHSHKKKYPMCLEWQEDVLAFVWWAEAEGWVKGKQVRRFDTSVMYSPNNCYIHTVGQPTQRKQ